MENKRAMIIAIICVVVSLVLVSAYTSKKRDEMTSEFGKEVHVIVAKRDIEEYSIIRPEMLEAVTVFTKFKQPQSISVVKDDQAAINSAMKDIIGKASYVPVYRGEQITLTKLVHQDGKPVLDHQLEKKMRAVTVTINPATGVGRLIRPGNHVDIMAAVNYERDSQMQFEIKTVFQNVLVLATGKNLQNSIPNRVSRNVLSALESTADGAHRKDLFTTTLDPSTNSRPDDNYATLTVQLSPEDSEKLLFLQHTIGDNRLYFTLRNGADQEVFAKMDTTILDQVLGPNSDYGRSKIRYEAPPPPKPRYYDQLGTETKPVY